jgi:hypothetical protein
MHHSPPLPLAQGFVPCQRIYEDRRTGEVLLAGPFNAILLESFPGGFRFSLTFFLVNGHGSYELDLELRGADGGTTWKGNWGRVVNCPDPLTQHREIVHDVVVVFPEPGQYDLVLLANGEDLTHYSLLVTYGDQG